jgi:hypothetical protein
MSCSRCGHPGFLLRPQGRNGAGGQSGNSTTFHQLTQGAANDPSLTRRQKASSSFLKKEPKNF